jgi:hypothetical protein
MKFAFIAASVLAASLALSALNAAPPATTNPAAAPAGKVQADKEWGLSQGTRILRVAPAGDVVFFTGLVDPRASAASAPTRAGAGPVAVFKLDTKTGACADAADVLPDTNGARADSVTTVLVSPDARHAVMFAPLPAPSEGAWQALYLLEVPKAKAVEVADFTHEGIGRRHAAWSGSDSFFVSGFVRGGDGTTRATKPTLYDTTGKKIGTYNAYVIVLGASDDGEIVLAQGDPDKLNEPAETQNLQKTFKLLVMDRSGRVKKAIDGAREGLLSRNGKYLAVSERVATSRPTMAQSQDFTTSVVSTDGSKDGEQKLEAAGSVVPIRVGDAGDLLGIERSRIDGGTLARWNLEGHKTTLMEGVRTAVVQGDTLYYMLADQPQTLKAVKLSKLK